MASHDPSPVLITGCSTGIGRATAERLAGKGMRVWASARRLDSIEDLAAKGCRLVAIDVTDEESMRAGVEQVEAGDGPVGALVNNAGYSQSGALEELPLDSVRRQFETNVFGLLRMCQLVLPGMRRAGRGRIVNLSSMGGRLTFPGGGVYHGTKYAVEALSDVLRFEVSGFGVHVALIEPGLIRTRFGETAAAGVEHGDGAYAGFNASVAATMHQVYEGPMSRLGAGPGAVARAIERALTANRPRTRYPVTASARLLLAVRGLVPDRAWDSMMRSTFPQPGRR
jgi:NADP-dependent 3-hydroxy acid dehydrogenase YdfG